MAEMIQRSALIQLESRVSWSMLNMCQPSLSAINTILKTQRVPTSNLSLKKAGVITITTTMAVTTLICG